MTSTECCNKCGPRKHYFYHTASHEIRRRLKHLLSRKHEGTRILLVGRSYGTRTLVFKFIFYIQSSPSPRQPCAIPLLPTSCRHSSHRKQCRLIRHLQTIILIRLQYTVPAVVPTTHWLQPIKVYQSRSLTSTSINIHSSNNRRTIVMQTDMRGMGTCSRRPRLQVEERDRKEIACAKHATRAAYEK